MPLTYIDDPKKTDLLLSAEPQSPKPAQLPAIPGLTWAAEATPAPQTNAQPELPKIQGLTWAAQPAPAVTPADPAPAQAPSATPQAPLPTKSRYGIQRVLAGAARGTETGVAGMVKIGAQQADVASSRTFRLANAEQKGGFGKLAFASKTAAEAGQNVANLLKATAKNIEEGARTGWERPEQPVLDENLRANVMEVNQRHVADSGSEAHIRDLNEIMRNALWSQHPIAHVLELGAEGLASWATAIGATVLTKNSWAGATLLGAQQGADTYEAARDKGVSVEKANMLAGLDFAWATVTERLALPKVLEGRTLLKRLITGSLSEGFQEVSQQLYSNAVAKLGYDEGRKMMEGVVDSFVAAGLLGGITAGVFGTAQIQAGKDLTDKLIALGVKPEVVKSSGIVQDVLQTETMEERQAKLLEFITQQTEEGAQGNAIQEPGATPEIRGVSGPGGNLPGEVQGMGQGNGQPPTPGANAPQAAQAASPAAPGRLTPEENARVLQSIQQRLQDSRVPEGKTLAKDAQGQWTSLQTVDPMQARPDRAAQVTASEALAQRHGHRVLWVQNNTPDVLAFKGTVEGDTVILDVNGSDPFQQTYLHEFTHLLETTKPQLYATLMSVAQEEGSGFAQYKAKLIAKYEAQGIRTNADDKWAWNELLADTLGAEGQNPTFWEDLYQRSPDLVRGMVEVVRTVLDAIGISTANRPDMAQYYDNFQRVHDTAISVLAQHAGEQAKAPTVEANPAVVAPPSVPPPAESATIPAAVPTPEIAPVTPAPIAEVPPVSATPTGAPPPESPSRPETPPLETPPAEARPIAAGQIEVPSAEAKAPRPEVIPVNAKKPNKRPRPEQDVLDTRLEGFRQWILGAGGIRWRKQYAEEMRGVPPGYRAAESEGTLGKGLEWDVVLEKAQEQGIIPENATGADDIAQALKGQLKTVTKARKEAELQDVESVVEERMKRLAVSGEEVAAMAKRGEVSPEFARSWAGWGKSEAKPYEIGDAKAYKQGKKWFLKVPGMPAGEGYRELDTKKDKELVRLLNRIGGENAPESVRPEDQDVIPFSIEDRKRETHEGHAFYVSPTTGGFNVSVTPNGRRVIGEARTEGQAQEIARRFYQEQQKAPPLSVDIPGRLEVLYRRRAELTDELSQADDPAAYLKLRTRIDAIAADMRRIAQLDQTTMKGPSLTEQIAKAAAPLSAEEPDQPKIEQHKFPKWLIQDFSLTEETRRIMEQSLEYASRSNKDAMRAAKAFIEENGVLGSSQRVFQPDLRVDDEVQTVISMVVLDALDDIIRTSGDSAIRDRAADEIIDLQKRSNEWDLHKARSVQIRRGWGKSLRNSFTSMKLWMRTAEQASPKEAAPAATATSEEVAKIIQERAKALEDNAALKKLSDDILERYKRVYSVVRKYRENMTPARVRRPAVDAAQAKLTASVQAKSAMLQKFAKKPAAPLATEGTPLAAEEAAGLTADDVQAFAESLTKEMIDSLRASTKAMDWAAFKLDWAKRMTADYDQRVSEALDAIWEQADATFYQVMQQAEREQGPAAPRPRRESKIVPGMDVDKLSELMTGPMPIPAVQQKTGLAALENWAAEQGLSEDSGAQAWERAKQEADKEAAKIYLDKWAAENNVASPSSVIDDLFSTVEWETFQAALTAEKLTPSITVKDTDTELRKRQRERAVIARIGLIRWQIKQQKLTLPKIIEMATAQREGVHQSIIEKLAPTTLPDADRVRLAMLITEELGKMEEAARTKALDRLTKAASPRVGEAKARSAAAAAIRMLRMGVLDVQKYQQEFERKFGMMPLTDEAKQTLITLSKKVDEAFKTTGSENSYQVHRATQGLMRYIASQVQRDWKDIPLAIVYSHVLSGPWTHVKNVSANTMNLVSNTLVMQALSVKHAAQDLDLRALNEPWIVLNGLLQGTRKGLWEAGNAMMTGESPFKYGAKTEYDPKRVNPIDVVPFFNKGTWNPAKLWRIPSRMLIAADMLTYKAAEEQKAALITLQTERSKPDMRGAELRRVVSEKMGWTTDKYNAFAKTATGEGLKIGSLGWKMRVAQLAEEKWPIETRERAAFHGLQVSFNSTPEGKIGTLSRKIGAHTNSPEGKVWKPFILFTNIVGNVLNVWVDWSPYGFRRAARGYMMGMNGEIRKFATDEKETLYAKAGTATALMIAVGLKAWAEQRRWDDDEEYRKKHPSGPVFQITATGPTSPAGRKMWLDAGNIPYSVKLHGKSYSFSLTPFMLALALPAHLMDWYRYERKEDMSADDIAGKIATTALLGVASTMLQASFLSTPNQFLRAISEPNQNTAGKMLTNTLSGFTSFVVPNLVQQLAKIWNPTVYQNDTWWQAFVRKIPIARAELRPMINVWGEPIQTSRFNFMYEADHADPLTLLLIRNNLWQDAPRRDYKVLDYDPVKKRWIDTPLGQDEDDYYDFAKTFGREFKKNLNEMLPMLEEHEKDHDFLKDRVSEARSRAMKVARNTLLTQRFSEQNPGQ